MADDAFEQDLARIAQELALDAEVVAELRRIRWSRETAHDLLQRVARRGLRWRERTLPKPRLPKR